MAPLYEVVVLAKAGKKTTPELKGLIRTCADMLWSKGAVLADIRSWGSSQLAYRIRKQGVNHYTAQYMSLHTYCSPATLRDLQYTLKNSDHVLRSMTLKQSSTPKLDDAARNPFRKPPPESASDLEGDPTEAARWEYRNLVMQRVFEGRTKQELIAEQLVRHRFQHAQLANPADARLPDDGGKRLGDVRRRGSGGGALGQGGGPGGAGGALGA